MQSKFFFLLLLAASFFHCKKDEAPPITDFVGIWAEQEPTDGSGGFAGDNLIIEFKADKSFQMQRQFWTDTPSACWNRTDRIMGEFSYDCRDLRLEGAYYDSTFQHTILPCTNETKYVRTSQFQFSNGELLLYPDADHPKARMRRQ